MKGYFSATPRFGILVPWFISLPLLFLWCAFALAFWLFYSMGMMVIIIVGAGQETWTWWRQRRAR